MLGALISISLTLLAVGLALVATYLLGLTLAAFAARGLRPPTSEARRRFAILIPAHNEEALIGRLLTNLAQLDYPATQYDVCVVADNCHDMTAVQARALGAKVYERFDLAQQAKGFALRWLLQRLREDDARYDAFVVLDADSVVTPDFLRRMDARLEAGSQVIQAYYSVLNAGESSLAALRYAALTAIHYLRPLGRSRLGLSVGLKGNGMCLAAPLLERFSWRWYTLAEDVEFHLALVREGIRVDFAPEAQVLADMPVSYVQAASQNARWERGRLQLMRGHVLGLALDGLRQRSALRLDAAAEQCIPPLSVPFALGALCLIGGLAMGSYLAAGLAALSLAAQVGYLLAGLALAGAPRRAYVALLGAPLYIAWKVNLYARALVGARTAAWVRTARGPTKADAGEPALLSVSSQVNARAGGSTQ
ncbi:MAG TPA: glycosyltransferase family 2 protein [Chloroflexota bacterium]|jgi:cellulose synthase/poly-beta-1,6-N-acetylglucosamine synthase-like glycosyltransferase